MKKSFLALTLFTVFSSCSVAQQQIQNRELPQIELVKQNRTIVKLASEEISKTLPQRIDKYTMLTVVESKDTTLTYIFDINTGAKSDDAVRQEDRTRMKETITAGVCRSSKRFLDAQITISYLYRSAKSKVRLFQFDVTQADCPIR